MMRFFRGGALFLRKVDRGFAQALPILAQNVSLARFASASAVARILENSFGAAQMASPFAKLANALRLLELNPCLLFAPWSYRGTGGWVKGARSG